MLRYNLPRQAQFRKTSQFSEEQIIHSFNKCLLNLHMPGAGDSVVNKIIVPGSGHLGRDSLR